MRPTIGITSNYNDIEKEYRLKNPYVLSVYRAGGTVIILPPVRDGDLIEHYTVICDGLVFSGGGDIDPDYWGEAPSNNLGPINPLRDYFEVLLAKKAAKMALPVLGICRGCQVLNVALGGSLYQHINSQLSHQQKAPRNYPFHSVTVENNTMLRKITRMRNIRVNSFHHQAVKKTGLNICISAYALDRTAEAIEKTDHPFFIGVQWHPESLEDKYSFSLFQALVEAAQKMKNSRR